MMTWHPLARSGIHYAGFRSMADKAARGILGLAPFDSTFGRIFQVGNRFR